MAQKRKKPSIHIPVTSMEEKKKPSRKAKRPATAEPGGAERFRPLENRSIRGRKENRAADHGSDLARTGSVDPAAARQVSEKEIEALVEKARDYDELLDSLQRLKAEYANFQKRTERERLQWRQSCLRDILQNILPVVDNLERALEAAEQHAGDPELVAGLTLVHRQFLQVLRKEKVEPFESTGRKFDPRYHEAVMVQETGREPPETVLSEMLRGYMIGDKVLRPAKVVVSRAPSGEPGESK